uniref:Uncharacterized protein n=1 Tax=Amblyomma triste TaxID=251400 RepID=A0A023G4B6_AMBTT
MAMKTAFLVLVWCYAPLAQSHFVSGNDRRLYKGKGLEDSSGASSEELCPVDKTDVGSSGLGIDDLQDADSDGDNQKESKEVPRPQAPGLEDSIESNPVGPVLDDLSDADTAGPGLHDFTHADNTGPGIEDVSDAEPTGPGIDDLQDADSYGDNQKESKEVTRPQGPGIEDVSDPEPTGPGLDDVIDADTLVRGPDDASNADTPGPGFEDVSDAVPTGPRP